MSLLKSFSGLMRSGNITRAVASAVLVSVTLLSVLLFSCNEVEPDLGGNTPAAITIIVSGGVRSGITGRPISGAAVTLVQAGKTVKTAETSADGSYSFNGVEAGAGYTVTASAPIYIDSETAVFAVSGTQSVEEITLERQWPSEGTVVVESVPMNHIAFAPDGALYIASYNDHKIRKIAPGGTTVIDYAGTGNEGGQDGSLATATFYRPNGIAVSADGATVYVAEDSGHRIRQITNGEVSTITGTGTGGDSGDGGDAKLAQIKNPNGVAVDTAGNVYISDSQNKKIRKISAEDGKITTIESLGLQTPNGIAVDTQGNVYFSKNHNVSKRTPGGTASSVIVGTGSSGTELPNLYIPYGIVIDAAGTVYVADSENRRIVKVTADGTASVLVGNVSDPKRLAIGPDGGLYIVSGGNRIIKY